MFVHSYLFHRIQLGHNRIWIYQTSPRFMNSHWYRIMVIKLTTKPGRVSALYKYTKNRFNRIELLSYLSKHFRTANKVVHPLLHSNQLKIQILHMKSIKAKKSHKIFFPPPNFNTLKVIPLPSPGWLVNTIFLASTILGDPKYTVKPIKYVQLWYPCTIASQYWNTPLILIQSCSLSGNIFTSWDVLAKDAKKICKSF